MCYDVPEFPGEVLHVEQADLSHDGGGGQQPGGGGGEESAHGDVVLGRLLVSR